MTTCEKCGTWLYEGNKTLMGHIHKCAPEYEVIHEWDEGDWSDAILVYAYDYEEAATKGAEKYDSGCGEGAREKVLHVRKSGDSVVRKFDITFDYSVDYYAHEQDLPTKG